MLKNAPAPPGSAPEMIKFNIKCFRESEHWYF